MLHCARERETYASSASARGAEPAAAHQTARTQAEGDLVLLTEGVGRGSQAPTRATDEEIASA